MEQSDNLCPQSPGGSAVGGPVWGNADQERRNHL